jgi:hypothetical protein
MKILENLYNYFKINYYIKNNVKIDVKIDGIKIYDNEILNNDNEILNNYNTKRLNNIIHNIKNLQILDDKDILFIELLPNNDLNKIITLLNINNKMLTSLLEEYMEEYMESNNVNYNNNLSIKT